MLKNKMKKIISSIAQIADEVPFVLFTLSAVLQSVERLNKNVFVINYKFGYTTQG